MNIWNSILSDFDIRIHAWKLFIALFSHTAVKFWLKRILIGVKNEMENSNLAIFDQNYVALSITHTLCIHFNTFHWFLNQIVYKHSVHDVLIHWINVFFYTFKAIDIMRIDWITGNWYFVSPDADVIALCNPPMTICSTVVEIFGQKINTLELDPIKG